MPLFDYVCSACEHEEEVLQKSNEPPPLTCPSCLRKATMSKAISNVSFTLKGGGWFKDGYTKPKQNEVVKED